MSGHKKPEAGYLSRAISLTLPKRKWEAIEAAAKQNYRALNAEIAVRVLESIHEEQT